MFKKITLLDREVEYELVYKNVKNINLRVRSDTSIYVSANPRISVKVIEDFIKTHSSFILSNIDSFSKLSTNSVDKLQFANGERIRFLGNDLPITLVKGKNKVATDGKIVLISTNNVDNLSIKKRLVERWLQTKLEDLIIHLISKNICHFSSFNIKEPQIKYRTMRSRWGSCNTKIQVITFAKQLIAYPMQSIEYVVVHELCHLVVPNHSKKFYLLVEKILPDWKQRKKLLSCMQFDG